jgi:predicted transcriptional regulator
MTRLSLEIDERLLGALDRAAEQEHASRDQTVLQAIELGLQAIQRKRRLEEQYRDAYAKHPVQPDEFATHPDDLAGPDDSEDWK